ncbi:hypothetical protein SUGI_0425730 [Cryptomeria japonica]|nr:hypothetical protein SUGI_0425730 [Cryptomeria japonica]
MDPNPLTLALQDFDSMLLDDHSSNPAMDEDLWLNSCHILHDYKFISPDSIPRPPDNLTRNPNDEEAPIAAADMEFDEISPFSSEMSSNFRVWDLNTENPELEIGTLAEILSSILAQTEDCMSYDALDLFSGRSPRLSDDVFTFRDMKSALEEHNVDRLSAILEGLGISGRNWKKG